MSDEGGSPVDSGVAAAYTLRRGVTSRSTCSRPRRRGPDEVGRRHVRHRRCVFDERERQKVRSAEFNNILLGLKKRSLEKMKKFHLFQTKQGYVRGAKKTSKLAKSWFCLRWGEGVERDDDRTKPSAREGAARCRGREVLAMSSRRGPPVGESRPASAQPDEYRHRASFTPHSPDGTYHYQVHRLDEEEAWGRGGTRGTRVHGVGRRAKRKGKGGGKGHERRALVLFNGRVLPPRTPPARSRVIERVYVCALFLRGKRLKRISFHSLDEMMTFSPFRDESARATRSDATDPSHGFRWRTSAVP